MGAAPPGQAEWRKLQRATAAHSTLVVADTNSVKLRASGGFERATGTVAARREDQDGSVLVDARHDLYARRFGLTHRRRLFLAAGGEDLRGEDTLTAAPGKGAKGNGGQDFTLRFHLHPDLSAAGRRRAAAPAARRLLAHALLGGGDGAGRVGLFRP
jgi:uncharacterized heparinase superfamily protein